ncbi:restriction endonuclease subunit S [Nonlabens tegetincola]|uniref:restriction endonuclease subunit S n=1 Tax=Nonlabens tegetincola TaxID=323273 RepID=UPI0015E38955|nr:restriction endonuclease subunit S [Nonlabens tegetincola]
MTQNIDLNYLDKSTWETFKFEEIAHKVSKTVKPDEALVDIYIGLEHIDTNDIHIRRKGVPADVKGGKLRCYPGDIIFGKRRAYQRKAAIVDFHGICSAHAFVFRANSEVIDPKLFPFFLHSDQFMHRMVDISVGGLSPTINWGDLKQQEFLLPPKDHQAQLAELLWAMDEVVERENEVLKHFNILKKSKQKKLLLPEISDKWESIKLHQGFDKITKKNKENLSDNVLTISASQGLINQEEYFKRQVASKNLSNYYVLETNDFAYNKSYSNGYPAGAIKVLNKYKIGLVSPLYICFRSKLNEHYNSYYEYLFDYGYLNKQILSIAKEGARNHGLLNVASSDFFNLKIPKPTQEYLDRIVPILRTLDAIQGSIESKISSSKALQKSIINQVF